MRCCGVFFISRRIQFFSQLCMTNFKNKNQLNFKSNKNSLFCSQKPHNNSIVIPKSKSGFSIFNSKSYKPTVVYILFLFSYECAVVNIHTAFYKCIHTLNGLW